MGDFSIMSKSGLKYWSAIVCYWKSFTDIVLTYVLESVSRGATTGLGQDVPGFSKLSHWTIWILASSVFIAQVCLPIEMSL